MPPPPLDVRLQPLGDVAALGERWRDLEDGSRESFFLGWTWTGAWLSLLEEKPLLLSARVAGRDVALALVGRAMARRPLGRVATLYLNQSGRTEADRPFIEYNGLLRANDAPPGLEQAAIAALLEQRGWRALRLSGLAPDDPLIAAGSFRRRLLIGESPAYLVDLAAVRAAGGDYLSLLSANSRNQIRRSIREHGGGEAEILSASDPAEAAEWLGEMRALNAGRHIDNAWEEPLFRAFLHELLARGMPRGEVELLRIARGGQLLGYLFNFLYRRRAMNYQSAFVPAPSSRSKPGLMCHAAAVTRYAAMDLAAYSLLAGNDRYKQSLSTGAEALQWWSLERFSPRLEVEYWLRRLFRRPVSA